jgi:hypothetical protein
MTDLYDFVERWETEDDREAPDADWFDWDTWIDSHEDDDDA